MLRPTLTAVGQGLATEMGAILDRLGLDHPDLLAELSRYIAQLHEHHPDWIPVMRDTHERLLTRRMGTTRPRSSPQPRNSSSPRSQHHHAPR